LKINLVHFLVLIFANQLFAVTLLDKYSTKLTHTFEENLGQIKYPDHMPATEIKYVFKQGNLKIFLLKTGLAYQLEKYEQDTTQTTELPEIHPDSYRDSGSFLQTYRMDMELVGANPNPEIIAEGKSADYTNYYLPDLIQTHSYQKVIYKNIYPGIDWVIYSTPSSPYGGGKGGVKYDFIVHSNADPSLIKLKYTHAERIYLDMDGNLILRNRLGDIKENAPVAFQNNENIPIRFRLQDSNVLSYELPTYNKDKMLVIDPKLDWSTYYGGSGEDNVNGSKIDNLNNIYLYGTTKSSSNIAFSGFQNNFISIGFNTMNGMIIKFDKNGQRLWASYYGINYNIVDAAIDNKSNLILVGMTTNTTQNFSQNGHQNNYGGGNVDGLIVKLDSAGSRIWASYYGGSGADRILSCAIDDSNNIYFFGQSNSTQNIALNGHQDTIYPKYVLGVLIQNNFIAKFNSSGIRQWASYYGLGNQGTGSIALDNHALYLNILHRGADTMLLYTSSYSIDTQNFAISIAKFNLNGQRIYGKPILQNFAFINSSTKMVCHKGYLYLYTSETNSLTTLASGFQPNNGGGGDMFITKLDSNGNELWSSYCGGNGYEVGQDIGFDKHDNLYLTGATGSNLGINYKGLDTSLTGGADIFLTKVSKTGQRIWSSYIGGNGWEGAASVNSDNSDNLYLSGTTTSTSGISLNGFQNTNNGQYDAFLMKISCSHYDTIRDTICRGDSLYYRNKYFTQAGLYTDSLLTWDICDSFITLHLTLLRKDTTYLYDTICSGTSYVWNGTYRTMSGVYRDTLVNNVGCDSFLVLNLLVKRTDSVQVYDTLCNNLPKNFNGQNLTLAGVYRDTLKNIVGCDSHIFYHFIPKRVYETLLSRAICASDSSLFGGKYRNLAGIYYDTLKTIRNCDSVLKLTLTVYPLDTTYQTQPICRGKSYNFYSQVLTSQGTYSHKFTNRNGCDSLILMTISVIDSSTYSFSRMLCSGQSFPFNNQNLTQAGVYRDTFMNYLGCDSFVTLNLSFGLVLYDTLRQTVCAGQVFRGYSSPGTYYETYKSNQGCDSVLTIYLKHLPATEYKTIQHSKCGAFRYGSSTYTQNDSFTETIKNSLNCDSIVTKHLVTITKPNPIVLEPKSIPFCEEILHRNQAKTQSFYTQDTVKSAEYPYCDSLYQPIFYQREVRPDLAIYAASDTVVRGQTIQLSAALANNYRWNTGEQTTVIRPKIEESAIFTVRGWNLENCESQASISITAIEPLIIDFPTAFSPNGDGLNDSFYPNTNQSIFIESFDIYNRIGEKVYSYTPQSPSWNGFYLGQPAAMGVYSYILNYRFLGNRFTKTGEVMVVR
jgi:gliding motility-associated-like protein